MSKEIEIENPDFYEYQVPKTRTRKRLLEMKEIGMQIVGYGQFGIDGVISGIWIERVWHESDSDWAEYLEWMKSVIEKQ